MTRFTLMMAVVAMFSYGPLLAGGVEVEEGTAKFTVVEHAGGTHVHPHGFVGKNGKMMKHDHKKTLFSFGPFTLFSLKGTFDKAKKTVKKAGHKAHEMASKVVHSDVTKDLAKSAGHKAMDKVGEAIASGAAKEVIKGAAGAAMGLMIK